MLQVLIWSSVGGQAAAEHLESLCSVHQSSGRCITKGICSFCSAFFSASVLLLFISSRYRKVLSTGCKNGLPLAYIFYQRHSCSQPSNHVNNKDDGKRAGTGSPCNNRHLRCCCCCLCKEAELPPHPHPSVIRCTRCSLSSVSFRDSTTCLTSSSGGSTPPPTTWCMARTRTVTAARYAAIPI